MDKKPWYQSKTLWFNILGGAGALFGSGGMFGQVFSPEEVGAVMAVGNTILRLTTSKGLTG